MKAEPVGSKRSTSSSRGASSPALVALSCLVGGTSVVSAFTTSTQVIKPQLLTVVKTRNSRVLLRMSGVPPGVRHSVWVHRRFGAFLAYLCYP